MARQKFDFQSTLKQSISSNVTEPESNAASLVQSLEQEETQSPLDAYKIIPRNKIRFNKKNNYPLEEIEKLKKYMLQYGVLQDILVIYSTEEDMYIVEAGHRRTTGLDQLIEEYQYWDGDPEDEDYLLYLKNIKCYEKGYVCKVITKLHEDVEYDLSDDEIDESVIDSEIRVIITNEGTRNISPAVRAKNVLRLSKLYELKNRGKMHSQKTNVNETISENLSIGVTQVKNYKNVDKLIPELKQLFDQEKITLKTAVSYSSLDEDAQYEIFETYKANTSSEDKEEIKQLKKERQQLLEELKERQSKAEPQLISDTGNNRKLISLLVENISSSIQELNKNMNYLLSQDPDATEWIESQREHLKELL